ncbi:outer membrane protein [Taklimakanibacter lacteus]|uniref:outer membrane protein n=1 Tax=Taklimakanibacter lacteus TaxID=2268456 RepID=UPI000E663060
MAGARLQSKLIAAALVAGSAGAAQGQEVDWTGFYAGVHAEYLWGEPTVDGSIAPFIFDEDIDGFGGGAQVGFNYQIDHFLIGAEADITGLDTDGEVFNLKNPGFSEGITVDLDWLATLRARAGFVFDSILVYGTGGFAWGGGDSDYFGFGDFDSKSSLSWSGYTIGAGAEYLLNDRISVKAEYLYVDLDNEDLDVQISGYRDVGIEANIVRLGVNYNLGAP